MQATSSPRPEPHLEAHHHPDRTGHRHPRTPPAPTEPGKETLAGPRWHETGLVFTARYGKPLDPDSPPSIFDRFRTIAELPHFRIHNLRYTTATLLREEGTELHVISGALGHAHLNAGPFFNYRLPYPCRQAN
ncbi:tyrosine-type recombinase/integrase [Actinospica robiniae]|uniref:tyrosine-type recombinase/integrase n=1 Tax=Actinospica robiniae TaxID=304901 RepID=UPI003CCC4004